MGELLAKENLISPLQQHKAIETQRSIGVRLGHQLTKLGYEAFRPGQREAIETLLEVGRLLLVAPTGGGKSLTYQLPATMLPMASLPLSPTGTSAW